MGVAAGGASVGDGVGDEVGITVGAGGDEDSGVGVAARAIALDAVAAGVGVDSETLPCPAANWLTTNATPSTLIPSPTPMEALPTVRSADRTSGERPTRPGPLPRSLRENVPLSLRRGATH